MLTYFICAVCGFLAVLLVHEIGHLVAARWCGVRVLSISAGLGPEVIGFTDRLGTRWTLSVLPLGASLKMSDDRGSSGLHTTPVTADMFSSKSLTQRAMIYAAGPVFSLIFATVIFGSLFALFGGDAKPGAYSDKPEVMIASLLGQFSILVACFQLIPVLPLDGGWLAMFGIEAITGRQISKHVQKKLYLAGFLIVGTVEISIGVIMGHLVWATWAQL